jgi:hypothetical protein
VFNQSYIYCTETGSKAWFWSEDNLFYFTGFDGNKNSLLYYFFLAAYRVYKGFYREITVRDSFPLHLAYPRLRLVLQDLIAPFWIYLHADYELKYTGIDNPVMPSSLKMESRMITRRGKKKSGRDYRFVIELDEKGLVGFAVTNGADTTKVRCTE